MGVTKTKKSLFHKPIFHLFLIAFVGLLAYSNTFNVPFQFDDKSKIIENYKLKDIANFWPLSGTRWFGFFTLALNYKLHGIDVAGYHIFNLTIHILNAILVYWLVTLTFKTPYFKVSVNSVSDSMVRQAHHDCHPEQRRRVTLETDTVHYSVIALFSALIFVSHPIQTQAVTYIWQRVTSLATMFYLLSLVMYIKWRLISAIERQNDSKEKISWRLSHCRTAGLSLYLISILSAVLAMVTKEISFTLPFILIFYEFCFLNKSLVCQPRMRRFLYLIPFLLVLIIIPLNLISHSERIDMYGIDTGEELRIQQLKDLTTLSKYEYLMTQFRTIVTYIRLLFFPINQNLDYDYPVYTSFFEPQVVLSFLFLLSIFGLGVYLFYRSRCTIHDSRFTIHDTRITHHVSRLIAFGILWFFVTLSIESSIIPIADVIFEHRVYLPSIGFIIAFSTALFHVFQRVISTTVRSATGRIRRGEQNDRTSKRSSSFSFLPIALPLYCAVALIVFLSIATYQRNSIWLDKINLWEDVVRKSPGKARGHTDLGIALRDKGLIDKAIEHYMTSIILKPDYAQAYNNLGNIYYYNKHLPSKAIEFYKTALTLKPNYADAYYNLGYAYENEGLIEDAIKCYTSALKVTPDDADIHFNLGFIYLKAGHIEMASNELKNVLQINPRHYKARTLLDSIK
ncbi:MAG: tetratricopeptide repeat protein [Nitrospirae bacterium]|nr:tetratricopeptide repeat protein [Nitrospirota bacterium]